MKLTNAIKKLEKEGYKVSKLTNNNFNNTYLAEKENQKDFIKLYSQSEKVIIIDLRRKGQEDDSITDYHAGTFCKNLAQALRLANHSNYIESFE